MVAHDFPCKVCTHRAGRHFASISDDLGICLDCVLNGDRRTQMEEEHWHNFEGDNLKFMELKNKKKELRSE